MPRRRKTDAEEILENGLKDTNLVQKSKPLFSLWGSGLSLGEFKILDTYLSRIDSHNPDAREVHFTKGELETALGVKRIRQDVLEERLRHLMGTVVKISDGRKNNGFTMITLFSMAIAKKNNSTDLWDVTLKCTEEAKEYFFNIDQIGYLRYKIGVITKINSVYSYILFQYLEYNRFRSEWDADLDELKEIMQCSQPSYKQYYRFNDLVLKKCQKELNEKTDCHFSYEPIRKGRKVSSIRFTLEPLSVAIESPMPDQLTIADYEDLNQDPDDPLALLSAACDDEFSREQMDVLLAAIATKDLPPHPDGLEFARYHYLQQQYAMLNVRAASGKIKHRFEYLLKMIQNDKEGKSK